MSTPTEVIGGPRLRSDIIKISGIVVARECLGVRGDEEEPQTFNEVPA
jgi:hypothetical protein